MQVVKKNSALLYFIFISYFFKYLIHYFYIYSRVLHCFYDVQNVPFLFYYNTFYLKRFFNFYCIFFNNVEQTQCMLFGKAYI